MKRGPGQNNGRLRPTTDGNRFDARGRRTSPVRTAAEIDLDNRVRRVFSDGPAVSRAVQEIREGRGRPCSSLARRAVELHEADASGLFIRVLDTLRAWHQDHFSGRSQ